MMKKLLSCAVALAFFSGVASASSNLVVSTEGGQLEGFTKTVPGTQSKVETFLAVPFAAAPFVGTVGRAPNRLFRGKASKKPIRHHRHAVKGMSVAKIASTLTFIGRPEPKRMRS